MRKDTITHTITFNRSRKTYTIRCYENGKLYAKYRSYPQGSKYSEYWTEGDIRQLLKSNDYYEVKRNFTWKQLRKTR